MEYKINFWLFLVKLITFKKNNQRPNKGSDRDCVWQENLDFGVGEQKSQKE